MLQGNSFSESPDFVAERLPSHTRSFSSEKILQEFRELQRAGQQQAQPHAQQQLLGQSVSHSEGGSELLDLELLRICFSSET
jgi:hypothetical protein